MAKAVFEAPISSSDQPNQQQTSQKYGIIPKPRSGSAQPAEQKSTNQHILIPIYVSADEHDHATQFIEQQLRNRAAIRAGAFLIGLLEKLHAIPNEMAAEEKTARESAIAQIDDLLIEVQKYEDATGKFNNSQFTEDFIDTLSEDDINNNAVIQLVRNAIRQVRKSSNENSFAETQLVTVQRIALMGIAKQRDQ